MDSAVVPKFTSIPQELVDAIVNEVGEIETLKACSLVASTFRHPSRRLLLSSLTIEATKDHTPLSRLFSESPYIAKYVVCLTIKTPVNGKASLDVECFSSILANLQNVRGCTLEGEWHSPDDKHNSRDSKIPPLLLDFLARQPLRELRLTHIELTPAVLWAFVAAVPVLCFQDVSMQEATTDTIAPAAVTSPPFFNSLVLSFGADVGRFLSRPENISCVTKLRHLSIKGYFHFQDAVWFDPLIQAASATLEHIQFDCSTRASQPWPVALPPFPALGTVQFSIPGMVSGIEKTVVISEAVKSLSSLATPQMSPALANIIVNQWDTSLGTFNRDESLYVPLMRKLDAVLMAYPTTLCIRWALAMYGEDRNWHWTRFVENMRRGMPGARTSGRLVLEDKYVRPQPMSSTRTDWPRHTLSDCKKFLKDL
ncbi:hypothetical protein MSAN_00789100 [Mycena sanguinolenta]|uniref:F-box domain-containing protein n=1 Tax=Mycena sanguinolenta TaxID=230812 RepID=A0A8H7DBZ9_9AGAR|nr:hypothetical protein MSAN_00789100 [Mycena sanguinolenta]